VGGCVKVGVKRVRTATAVKRNLDGHTYNQHQEWGLRAAPKDDITYADADGLETVTHYLCADNCPVHALDEQAGERKSGKKTAGQPQGVNFQQSHKRIAQYDIPASTGSASRFFTIFPPEPPLFYASKASRREREQGIEGMEAKPGTARMVASEWKADDRHPEGGYPTAPQSVSRNHHPTVKSLALMSWLITLITPPGGIVLDPFAGSGSTGVSAIKGGWDFIGIEQEGDYVDIGRARCTWAEREAAKHNAQQLRMAV
jgi:site-specific DNA-methyltransferase (adenine-specific)